MTAGKLIEGDESSLYVCKRCGIGTRHQRVYWRRRFPLGYVARERWVEGWLCNECGLRTRVRTVERSAVEQPRVEQPPSDPTEE